MLLPGLPDEGVYLCPQFPGVLVTLRGFLHQQDFYLADGLPLPEQFVTEVLDLGLEAYHLRTPDRLEHREGHFELPSVEHLVEVIHCPVHPSAQELLLLVGHEFLHSGIVQDLFDLVFHRAVLEAYRLRFRLVGFEWSSHDYHYLCCWL